MIFIKRNEGYAKIGATGVIGSCRAFGNDRMNRGRAQTGAKMGDGFVRSPARQPQEGGDRHRPWADSNWSVSVKEPNRGCEAKRTVAATALWAARAVRVVRTMCFGPGHVGHRGLDMGVVPGTMRQCGLLRQEKRKGQ